MKRIVPEWKKNLNDKKRAYFPDPLITQIVMLRDQSTNGGKKLFDFTVC